MICPHCQAADIPAGSLICPRCGVSPDMKPGEVGTGPGAGGLAETLIPARNPKALVAYYLGLFGSLLSCIPILGLIGFGMSIASLVLGLKGRQAAIANPQIKGEVHAWIGIVGWILGILFGLLMQGALLVSLIGELAKRH